MNAIFLDERLLKYFIINIDKVKPTKESIVIFVDHLFDICNNYKNDYIDPQTTQKQAKALYKRIFNAWNLFVNNIPTKYNVWKKILYKAYEEEARSNKKLIEILEL